MKAAIVGAIVGLVLLLGGCATAPDIRDDLTVAAKALSQNCPAGLDSPRCAELEVAVRDAVSAVRDSVSVPSDENVLRAAVAVAKAVKLAKAFELPDAGK